MLTAAQIAKLEELGFKRQPNRDAPSYLKIYRVQGRVYVFFYESFNTVAQANVYTCKQAQSDILELAKVGIK